MPVRYTCGYLDVQGVQHTLAQTGITPDAYIFIGVDLLRRPIGLKSLLHQDLHSLLSCDLLVAGESTC